MKDNVNNQHKQAASGEVKDTASQPKMKTCKDCGNTYPVDYEHWRWKDYGYVMRPLARCKPCHRKYEAQKHRESRARKRQVVDKS